MRIHSSLIEPSFDLDCCKDALARACPQKHNRHCGKEQIALTVCGKTELLAINMILRCYAEGTRDGWEALCLDLDIAVEGRSFEEVYKLLDDAISQYAEYVSELPEKDQAQFLNRKAPLADRLRFLWHVARTTLTGDGSGEKQRFEYTKPLLAA